MTIRLLSALNLDQLDQIYTILIEECSTSADRVDRQSFLASMIAGCREYSFRGALGFGGKLYVQNNKVWIACYNEDTTPTRQAMIDNAHRRLEALLL